MSWARVQGTGAQVSSGSTTTLTATFASAVTAGDLIVVGVSGASGTTPTVQDNKNSTNYTKAIANATDSFIFYYVAPVGGSGFAVTVNFGAASYSSISIDEFSFTSGATISVDSTGNSGGSAGTATLGGNLTVSGTDLIIASVQSTASATYTAGSGFTLGYTVNYASGTAFGIASEYLLNETSNINPTLGITSSWNMTAAAFKATGGSSASFTASPSAIPANHSGNITLTLTGTGTSWTSGSVVSIQNSVSSTTTVTKGTWTQGSGTAATLTVTTGAGTGTFTITIDGVVSGALTVDTSTFTVVPSTIPANHSGNITLTLTGTGTSWTSGQVVSIQNSVTGTTTVTAGTWTQSSGTAATLAVTTGAGPGRSRSPLMGWSPHRSPSARQASRSPRRVVARATTPTITATGTNTLWTLETASTLFSVSGGTGASISSISVTSNTAATFTLTVGSATGTLTITDVPTGDTAKLHGRQLHRLRP